jgi:rare lipoprotein A
LLGCALVLAGCSEHKHAAQTSVPPAPQPAVSTTPAQSGTTPPAPQPEISFPADAPVLYTETGWASWYGPAYHQRKSSNGEVYDMNGMTAAHRTLPLNSIVRVTNLTTKSSALLRITDRGPFVNDRIIDLSKAAAIKLDVWRPGKAKVRIEVLETPKPIETGGKWCVQIGGFKDAEEAARLKDKLTRRYHTAQVLEFTSPIGEEWIRVRVLQDDKKRAEEVMQETQTDAGVFLVRLD